MTNKLIVSFVFCLSLFSVSVCAGTYGGGSGTAAEPYRLGNPDHWRELTDTPNDWDGNFIMTDNINLADVVFLPVGTLSVPFTGVFDGNGHTIRNASIVWKEGEYVGLFGNVDTGGQIKNLGVADVLSWGSGYVGGLVGKNKGSISYCYITGTVHGSYIVITAYYHGGLAGYNSGLISNCGAIVDVDGVVTGGLVGYNDNYGQICKCYARGNVKGYPVGGLAGYHYPNPDQNYAGIRNCYATGLVSSSYGGADVGGLVGTGQYGLVYKSFWDIQTTGQTTSAGGNGKTTAQMKTMTTFSDEGWDFEDTWMMWLAPDEHYPELYLPMGPFILTMQTSPSQAVSSITPSTGKHFLNGLVEIHAADFAACPNRYTFDHWQGNVANPLSPSTTLFVDEDTTVTAVFTLVPPVCGDECHRYPKMDFSKNCRVDLADFVMFAAEWMDCTAPECN